jgi:hypothetical protein
MASSRDEVKLDIFPHIFPQSFFERMKGLAGSNKALAGSIMRWLHIPVLWDLDARLAMMRKFRGYRQVLTLSLPAIEYLAGPEESPALARLANEGMAEIVAEHPGEFPAFVASLPMNNVPAGARGDGLRDRKAGREGDTGLHERQRPAARRPGVLPGLRALREEIRSADLAAPGAAVPTSPTTSPRRSRSTRSGGSSAGPYEN